MFSLVGEILILLLVAFIIGAFIGWILWRYLAGDGVPTTPTHPVSELAPSAASVTPPPVKPAPVPAPAPVAATADTKDPADAEFSAVMEKDAVEMAIPADKREAAQKADAAGTRPKVLSAPIDGTPDNLKRVKGIGPKNEQALNSLGIFHFAQIAALSKPEVDWLGSFMAFPGRIERENWIQQADALSKGEETAFSKRVDKGEVDSSI